MFLDAFSLFLDDFSPFEDYVAKQKDVGAVPEIGDHTLKVYVAPSQEELTPGSKAFGARVAEAGAK